MAPELSATEVLLDGLNTLPAKGYLVAGGAVLGLYLLYQQALPKPIPGIPYNEDSAKRLMGDLPYLQEKLDKQVTPRSFFSEVVSKHGAPVVQYFMGPLGRPAVSIGDYREVHDLLLRHGNDLKRGQVIKDVWAGIVPAHFIGMEDQEPAFKSAKALGKDLMTPTFLNEVNAPASYNKVLNFIELWKLKTSLSQNHSFDAADDLGTLTYDIIMAAALNIDDEETLAMQYLAKLDSMPNAAIIPSSENQVATFPDIDLSDSLKSLYTIAEAAGGAFMAPSPKLFHFFNNRKASMKKAFHDRDTAILSYINDSVRRLEAAEAAGNAFKPTSAVDFIISREASAAKKEGRAPDFRSDTVVQIIFGYLLGGQDSTHSTLSFMVKYLGAEQAKQKMLRDTLRAAFPKSYASGEQPPMRDVVAAQIPYLDGFIEEVLRVGPPAFGVMRQAKNDIKVLGYTIPKETMIMFNTVGATYTEKGTMDPKTNEKLRSATSQSHASSYGYSDWAQSEFPPNEFHPERWLKESDDGSGKPVFNPKAGPFLSFSTGNRVCWGKRLAYLELKLVTTLLVWNFNFKPLPEGLLDYEFADSLFVKPKTCRVKLGSAWEV